MEIKLIRTKTLPKLIYYCIAAFVLCILLIIVPDTLQTKTIGFYGNFFNGSYFVEKILDNSPATVAGFKLGDQILGRNGISVQNWYDIYLDNKTEYLEKHNHISNNYLVYKVVRDQNLQEITLKPEGLTLRQAIEIYSYSIFFILVLAISIVLILLVNRTRLVYLIAMSFCFCAFWVATDTPYWTNFFSPLMINMNTPWYMIREFINITSLQLVVSTVLHVVLIFPYPRQIFNKQTWIFPLIYILPLGFLYVLILISPMELLSEKLVSVYYPERLYMNTMLITIISFGMIDSYRMRMNRIQKIQSGLLFTLIGLFLFLHLALWNVPIILTNKPLIPNYDWLFVPAMLIPIGMFFSISRHKLFGIRLLIRRRIHLIETLLRREKELVHRRDKDIDLLTNELQQLRDELKKYISDHIVDENANNILDIQEIMCLYPELVEIKDNHLIGNNKKWLKIFEEIVMASNINGSVLIFGESGTGKTDIARSIHKISNRKNNPYTEISCAQFEHADPAFALSRIFGIGSNHGLPNISKEGQTGLLEECDTGTLFLDDFDRLPLNVQDLLLYPLENKPFSPGIGLGEPRSVDIKYILATNRSPEELVQKGELHADVLARLTTRITVPPLRERLDDIPILVQYFIDHLNNEGVCTINEIDKNTLLYLKKYQYRDGNVRELMNEISIAAGKASIRKDDVLRAHHLSDKIVNKDKTLPEINDPSHQKIPDPVIPRTETREPDDSEAGEQQELKILRQNNFNIKLSEKELGLSQKSKTLSNYFRGICIKAFAENNWNINLAAIEIVGNDDPVMVPRIERKIRRYIFKIKQHMENTTEEVLFKKLPSIYRQYLVDTIQWLRTTDTDIC